MGVITKSDQFLYTGRGPIDSKALVKTYAELTNPATWTVNSVLVAYNGMVTAVWLNKTDTSKNGLYYLFDPQVVSALTKPDVTNEANWHRLGATDNINNITSKLQEIEASLADTNSRVEDLERHKTEFFTTRAEFPEEGATNKLYIAADERKTYGWHAAVGYFCVGEQNVAPDIICGGDAGIQVVE